MGKFHLNLVYQPGKDGISVCPMFYSPLGKCHRASGDSHRSNFSIKLLFSADDSVVANCYMKLAQEAQEQIFNRGGPTKRVSTRRKGSWCWSSPMNASFLPDGMGRMKWLKEWVHLTIR